MIFSKWIRFTKQAGRARIGLHLSPQKILAVKVEGDEPEFEQRSVPSADKLIATVSQLFSDTGWRGRVQVALSAELYQQFQMEKPKIPEEEVSAALGWNIRDLVKEPVTELVVDYYDLLQHAVSAPKVNLVCTRRSLVQELGEAIAEADCYLQGVTTWELALADLITEPEPVQVLLFQPAGAEPLLLAVHQHQLCFSRQLRGFSELANAPLGTLEPFIFDNFSLELQRSFDFIVSQLKLPETGKIYVASAAPDLGALVKKLHDVFDLPVTLLVNKAITTGVEYLPAFAALTEAEGAG
ncbi:type IV pilus biogenesis protein PilM [Dongshaea marina]|uniref:MSHA biogenesis protein MshI n=1 Tax=Dongshaea marina TaxID=2047966 RepID=UPI000D3EC062|nr:MSHA biogenesis protein MshI [Dongshaea marina]